CAWMRTRSSGSAAAGTRMEKFLGNRSVAPWPRSWRVGAPAPSGWRGWRRGGSRAARAIPRKRRFRSTCATRSLADDPSAQHVEVGGVDLVLVDVGLDRPLADEVAHTVGGIEGAHEAGVVG